MSTKNLWPTVFNFFVRSYAASKFEVSDQTLHIFSYINYPKVTQIIYSFLKLFFGSLYINEAFLQCKLS